MNRLILCVGILVGAASLLSCDRPAATALPLAPNGTTISAHFSPRGGCTSAVVAAISQARQSIDVQAYSFTSSPIAQALVEAHDRGVKVRVVLDKSQRTERYSSATFVHNHQIPTYIDDQHAIAHNKIMILDGQTIITGSFNFTKAAEESNAENLLIIGNNPELVAQYKQNFALHLAHSKTYQ